MNCRYCGDPYIPEDKRRVCATCGAPPPEGAQKSVRMRPDHYAGPYTSSVYMHNFGAVTSDDWMQYYYCLKVG